MDGVLDAGVCADRRRNRDREGPVKSLACYVVVVALAATVGYAVGWYVSEWLP